MNKYLEKIASWDNEDLEKAAGLGQMVWRAVGSGVNKVGRGVGAGLEKGDTGIRSSISRGIRRFGADLHQGRGNARLITGAVAGGAAAGYAAGKL